MNTRKCMTPRGLPEKRGRVFLPPSLAASARQDLPHCNDFSKLTHHHDPSTQKPTPTGAS